MKIDPLQAYNSLPKLPPAANVFNDVLILKKTNQANKAVSELNGLLRTLENPDIILEPLKVKEAVESSGIENINTTFSEALQAELFSTEKLSVEQKETKNYKKALLLGFQKIQKKQFLTTNDFVDIQKTLNIPHSGIRNLPGTRIGNSLTGQIFYTPPEGEDNIRNLLKNFEEYYNDHHTDPDYLIKMAILHYQFEAIHPFFDGNGRTGRILMVLYLTLHNILFSPTLFISKYINENRSKYYQLLKGVTFADAWQEWILFMLEATCQQARKTNQLILDILKLKNEFKTNVLSKLNLVYAPELSTYIFSNAFYTKTQLMAHTSIKSNKTAIEYFGILQEKGVLKIASSPTKEKLYYFPKFLELLESY